MCLKQFLYRWFITSLIFCAGILSGKSQEISEIQYDHFKDTLMVINEKVIDQYKVIMDRQEFKKCDTLKVNQKGLWVASFKMSAITLGQDITRSTNSSVISSEMMNEIINGNAKYKFIYLKDIILQSQDGKIYAPSTKYVKIIFSN